MVERAETQGWPSEVVDFLDACEAHGCQVKRRSCPDTSRDVVEYARVSCPAESHGGDRDAANVPVRFAHSTNTLLLKCHSHGCTFTEILAGVGMLDAPRVSAGDRDTGALTVAKWALDRGIDFDRAVSITKPGRYVWGDKRRHVFLYRDVSGLHQLRKTRIDRSDGKKRFVWERRVDGEWVKGTDGLVPHVYGVEQIGAIREVEWTCLVEGEKGARHLLALKHPALSLPGRWNAAYDDVFRPLKVIVVADRDTAGMKHARTSHEQLERLAVDHVVVQSATTGEHDDIVEHLEAGHDISELVVVELPLAASRGDPAPAVQAGPLTTAQQLVAIALEMFDLGISTDDRTFAVRRDGPAVTTLFRGSSSFRSALAGAHFRRSGNVASGSAIADALNVLEARAREGAPERVSIRVARVEGDIYVDLGDSSGRVVYVDEAGWSILDRSPALFRRTELTSALPEPDRDGDLVGGLRSLLNIDDESMPLLIAWLVACFLDIPVPIARLTGEQGAGKSTAAEIVTRLVDPSPAVLRSPPRDIGEWAVTVSAAHVSTFDNLSYIPLWLSDAMCQTVTGGAVLRRRLYTDDDVAVITLRRPLLLTSIDHGSVRGDLADRLVTFNLHPIPEAARRDDAEIKQRFLETWPALLGALYDMIARVLALLPTIALAERPRMADYSAVLAAVDVILETEGLDEYLRGRAGLSAEVVASDTVAEALVDFLHRIDIDEVVVMPDERIDSGWQGTATRLLKLLTPDRTPRGWPTTTQVLSGRLQRLAPDLREVGIVITHGRSGHARFIRIERATDPSEPSTSDDADDDDDA